MKRDAHYYVEALALLPHPEGGFYKEVFRSDLTVTKDALPKAFTGDRQMSTSIYFMLTSEKPSHFHKIRSDETWFFHDGATIDLHIIHPQGRYEKIRIGSELSSGDVYQYTVSRECWFAAEILPNDTADFALISCTVAPGFDFDDFELADGDQLCAQFPQHDILIKKLT